MRSRSSAATSTGRSGSTPRRATGRRRTGSSTAWHRPSTSSRRSPGPTAGRSSSADAAVSGPSTSERSAPACFWAFARSWQAIFRDGVCDHAIKELCRVYVSRTVKCEYCGNQRSEQARARGLTEAQYDDLLNFEKSERLSDREKAALAYAEAISWRLESSDALWERLYQHFSEPELVELGCFIALTMGHQSWLRQ